MNKPPTPVLIVAVVYFLVGVAGFVYHFRELTSGHGDAIAMELTEMLAVVSGVGLLLRQNWARWLALAWVGFHVAISIFHPLRELLAHAGLFIVIAWLLFRPGTALWFQEAKASS